MTHPVDAVYVDGAAVSKAAARTLARSEPYDFVTVAALQGYDLDNTPTCLISGVVYVYDSLDLSTADDGITCIVDLGGRRWKKPSNAPVTKTANFTVGVTENYIINNKTGSSNTATLPAAATYKGRVITILNYQAQTVISASSNVVPLVGGAAGTAILAATAGKWARLISDGTNWIIVEGN